MRSSTLRFRAKHNSFNCELQYNSIVKLLLTKIFYSYVNRDREITKRYVQHAEKCGVKGLFITVDAPQLGRREKDMRMRFVGDDAGAKVQEGQKVEKNQGVARAISVSSFDTLHSCAGILFLKSRSHSLTRVSIGTIFPGSRASRRVSPGLQTSLVAY